MIGNIVSEWLVKKANEKKYRLSPFLYGEISFESEKPITINSGNAYGFWIEILDDVKKQEVLDHYGKDENEIKILEEKWYPLYWGKAINPVQRIGSHYAPSSKTGAMNLKRDKAFLKKFKIIFGSVWVEKYEEFEKYLHKEYKPLYGTNRKGNEPSKIKLLNSDQIIEYDFQF